MCPPWVCFLVKPCPLTPPGMTPSTLAPLSCSTLKQDKIKSRSKSVHNIKHNKRVHSYTAIARIPQIGLAKIDCFLPKVLYHVFNPQWIPMSMKSYSWLIPQMQNLPYGQSQLCVRQVLLDEREIRALNPFCSKAHRTQRK